MSMPNRSRYLFGAVVLLLLGGCSGDKGFSDIDQFMEEARDTPRGFVKPLPEFKAYEAFSYRSSSRRAPFQPPVEVQLTMVNQEPKSDVKPDKDRPKELLEQFALDALSMVGTLRRSNDEGTRFALIKDDQGGIHRVRKGSHMGKNYGRVVGVDEEQVELIEIVPNGSGGWVERPRNLTLKEG